MDQDAPPAPVSFGRFLRRSRELRGLSQEEVIASTRLPARVVSALEEDDTTPMPDRAYALQYARAVAAAVGLDPEDVALRYEEWLLTLPPATLPPPPLPPSGPGRVLRPVRKVLGLPLRLSRDPLVWGVVVLTLLACLAVLLSRK